VRSHVQPSTRKSIITDNSSGYEIIIPAKWTIGGGFAILATSWMIAGRERIANKQIEHLRYDV
jgi:hypothetical protein